LAVTYDRVFARLVDTYPLGVPLNGQLSRRVGYAIG
jgi:hypothetical protein